MPIGEPALLIAFFLCAGLGIWGLARIFNIGAKFVEFEQSHDQRANLLIAIAAAETKKHRSSTTLNPAD